MKSRQSVQSTDGFQAILQTRALPSRPFAQENPEGATGAALPLGFEVTNLDLATAAPVQAKLTIGAPGDRYEQEADSMAAQVVERINGGGTETAQREAMPEEDELQMQPLANGIQREATPEEDELQMQPLANGIQREAMPEEDELQMRPLANGIQRSGSGATPASKTLETEIEQSRGRGQALPSNIQASMGQAFGADFSGVRVHAGSEKSHAMNESIGARAFTTGQDIFFRQGAYNPGSRGGQELLAHELTHVVQQNGAAVQPKADPE